MKNKNILFKNFKLDKKIINTKKILTELLKEDNKILQSLSTNYSDSYTKKSLSKYKNFKNIRIIGMGGSSLGTRAIYSFLKHKIKKKLIFFDNLETRELARNQKLYMFETTFTLFIAAILFKSTIFPKSRNTLSMY